MTSKATTLDQLPWELQGKIYFLAQLLGGDSHTLWNARAEELLRFMDGWNNETEKVIRQLYSLKPTEEVLW